MSLFQCSKCGCIENTALSMYHIQRLEKRPVECSACEPDPDSLDNTEGWHDRFPRRYLPKGQFVKDRNGNLIHRDTGKDYDTALESYEEWK